MSEVKTSLDYPWEVHPHTCAGDRGHPLYSVTTSPIDSPYWLIAAPLSYGTAEHIAELHNATLVNKNYEYSLEIRTKARASDDWSPWRDDSGYNNKHDGKFYSLSALKGMITRSKRHARYFFACEWRTLRRPQVHLPWEEFDVEV